MRTERMLAAARDLAVIGDKGFAARRILAALSSPDTTLEEVANLISHEPGLSARVLRVANSALYGVRGGVATLDRAFRLLGLDAVRGIAAAACFSRAIARATDAPIDSDELHRHCIAVAVAAETVAKERRARLAGEAFIAGLLHDFGVLVEMRILSRGASNGAPDVERQLEEIAQTHAQCAAVVLESWGLPESLIAAARHHHRPDETPTPHREITAVVHVADYLSRAAGFDFASETDAALPRDEALALLGLGAADLERIGADLGERVAVLWSALHAS